MKILLAKSILSIIAYFAYTHGYTCAHIKFIYFPEDGKSIETVADYYKFDKSMGLSYLDSKGAVITIPNGMYELE